MSNSNVTHEQVDFPSVPDDKEQFLAHLEGLAVGAVIDIAFEPLTDAARKKIEDFYNDPSYTPDQVERS